MIIDGNNLISHYLKNSIPLAVGKIGVTELNILYCIENNITDFIRKEAEDNAGLFPYNIETATIFMQEMYSALSCLDLIPIWNRVIPQFEDKIINKYCSKAYKTQLPHLEPYFFDVPWTNQLKDKRVLVFSPFAESIEENYKNFNNIWNGKLAANFDLKAIKYPFSLKLTGTSIYKSSIEIYKKYLDILHTEQFDVGIFGTGYTSILFAAECKRLNKAGIHLGGPTQILFGIKGKRWKDSPEFKSIYNNYWTTPLPSEIPNNKYLVEEGCYW